MPSQTRKYLYEFLTQAKNYIGAKNKKETKESWNKTEQFIAQLHSEMVRTTEVILGF